VRGKERILRPEVPERNPEHGTHHRLSMGCPKESLKEGDLDQSRTTLGKEGFTGGSKKHDEVICSQKRRSKEGGAHTKRGSA